MQNIVKQEIVSDIPVPCTGVTEIRAGMAVTVQIHVRHLFVLIVAVKCAVEI